MSPAAESVIERLDAARQRWWLFTLLSSAVLAASLSLSLLLLLLLGDALLRFTQGALWVAFLFWLGTTLGLLVVVVRRMLRDQRSLEATARRVEAEYPGLGSDLINVVQFSAASAAGNDAFRTAAVNQAAARIGGVRFEAAPTGESRWRRLVHCMQTPRDLAESTAGLLLLVVLAVVFHWTIPTWASAATRMMTPWRFVPSVGEVRIVEVVPGKDVEVMVGSPLEIAAVIDNPQGTPYRATLVIETASGDARRSLQPMASDEEHRRFTATLPSVIEPLDYRLEIGDSQTTEYHVGVRQKPTVAEVEVTYKYPAYLGRGPETFVPQNLDLEAPQYTVAELRIRPSVPVASGRVELDGQAILGRVEHEGELVVVPSLPLLRDGTFTVHLVNDAGHSDPTPRLNRIHVLPDRPPTVELAKPPRETASAPGADVAVVVRAVDDHGVGQLWLELKPQAETDAPPVQVQPWTDPAGATTVVRQHRLRLDPVEFPAGQTVLVRAVARDRRNVSELGRRLGPQETASAWHAVRLIAPEEKRAADAQEIDRIHQALWKLLDLQVRARVDAALIVAREPLADRVGLAGGVRMRQIEIQKSAGDLVQSIGSSDDETRRAIRQALSGLAVGEMLEAVRQCDALVRLSTPEQFDQPVGELLAVQDRIIEMLRKLLDAVRRAEGEELAEMGDRPGGDLPDDTQKKFQDLNDKLEEALRQQRKVIEAAEDLAKAPVEDFAEKQKKLLDALAAAEDNWSRFMTELNTDLSKLPEQDFANPSLLKELVEIQTEIRMAEDSELEKTLDIAVPLEQLGAEMAEEIATNLEKWLPDTPDRERWSQEEMLSDLGKEAPMAELPDELEDLMGELMEEEEDLFDEMEDISSSMADSLDAAAGWDALDGPISNMSAKGVTGNRLPNTSEIGGRSAEGRTGKSSGEFVGEEAVGKGGRKTPTRLTPDPYVKGEIDDRSTDPSGGATGGGKRSGQGGEGLEGPVPRPPAEEMGRLAGRQATLRNKAEGIDLQFEILEFHHADLQKMIDLMAQVERDLKAGRYQNALRQRRVLLEGLEGIRQYTEGEFELRPDTTANLPGDVQKEIFGSMQDPSPDGWEQLNREYFERLATGAGEDGE